VTTGVRSGIGLDSVNKMEQITLEYKEWMSVMLASVDDKELPVPDKWN
jgi:hypothetical protein